jgi:hypothetical protein
VLLFAIIGMMVIVDGWYRLDLSKLRFALIETASRLMARLVVSSAETSYGAT